MQTGRNCHAATPAQYTQLCLGTAQYLSVSGAILDLAETDYHLNIHNWITDLLGVTMNRGMENILW